MPQRAALYRRHHPAVEVHACHDAPVNETMIDVFQRPDGYFVVSAEQTTGGLWLYVSEPPTVIEPSADAVQLGTVVGSCLAHPRPIVPHPSQNDWTEVRRASLAPIMRAAKVRSWRSFLATARLISVDRSDQQYTVTPMQRRGNPSSAFTPDITQEQRLASPSKEALGQAVLVAFRAAQS